MENVTCKTYNSSPNFLYNISISMRYWIYLTKSIRKPVWIWYWIHIEFSIWKMSYQITFLFGKINMDSMWMLWVLYVRVFPVKIEKCKKPRGYKSSFYSLKVQIQNMPSLKLNSQTSLLVGSSITMPTLRIGNYICSSS